MSGMEQRALALIASLNPYHSSVKQVFILISKRKLRLREVNLPQVTQFISGKAVIPSLADPEDI